MPEARPQAFKVLEPSIKWFMARLCTLFENFDIPFVPLISSSYVPVSQVTLICNNKLSWWNKSMKSIFLSKHCYIWGSGWIWSIYPHNSAFIDCKCHFIVDACSTKLVWEKSSIQYNLWVIRLIDWAVCSVNGDDEPRSIIVVENLRPKNLKLSWVQQKV